MNDNRHPAGTSLGGQWAPGQAGEVDFDDAFDDLGYDAAPPPEDSTYEGGFSPDDWQVRPEMEGVRAENEKFGLAGFIHPSTRSDVDAALYQHINGEVSKDDLTYLHDKHFPATSEAEILDSLNNAKTELTADGPDSDPRWQESQSVLDDISIRDQSRRGLGPGARGVNIPEITSYGSGGGYANRWDGGNYERGMSTKEAAASIRKDIKSATETGFLSKDFKYSVRTENFAGGSAVSFNATPKEPVDPEVFTEKGEVNQYGDKMRSYEVAEMEDRMSAIADSYRSDRSDSMTDLSNTNFYCNPRVDRY